MTGHRANLHAFFFFRIRDTTSIDCWHGVCGEWVCIAARHFWRWFLCSLHFWWRSLCCDLVNRGRASVSFFVNKLVLCSNKMQIIETCLADGTFYFVFGGGGNRGNEGFHFAWCCLAQDASVISSVTKWVYPDHIKSQLRCRPGKRSPVSQLSQ